MSGNVTDLFHKVNSSFTVDIRIVQRRDTPSCWVGCYRLGALGLLAQLPTFLNSIWDDGNGPGNIDHTINHPSPWSRRLVCRVDEVDALLYIVYKNLQLTGPSSAFIATPVELVKGTFLTFFVIVITITMCCQVKLQLQMQKHARDREFSGPIHCVRRIVQTNGVLGLWTGLWGSILFRSNFLWMFSGYEVSDLLPDSV